MKLIFGFNETMFQCAIANSAIGIVMCCGMKIGLRV